MNTIVMRRINRYILNTHWILTIRYILFPNLIYLFFSKSRLPNLEQRGILRRKQNDDDYKLLRRVYNAGTETEIDIMNKMIEDVNNNKGDNKGDNKTKKSAAHTSGDAPSSSRRKKRREDSSARGKPENLSARGEKMSPSNQQALPERQPGGPGGPGGAGGAGGPTNVMASLKLKLPGKVYAKIDDATMEK
jgi:hypothetical protein